MPRYYIAILASLCFLGAAAFAIWPPGPGYEQLDSFLWRLGALTAVLWLAYPDLMRIPRWLALAVPVLVLVLVKWPKLIFVIVPALIVLVVLQRTMRRGE
jgi:hypothetical protein